MNVAQSGQVVIAVTTHGQQYLLSEPTFSVVHLNNVISLDIQVLTNYIASSKDLKDYVFQRLRTLKLESDIVRLEIGLLGIVLYDFG